MPLRCLITLTLRAVAAATPLYFDAAACRAADAVAAA